MTMQLGEHTVAITNFFERRNDLKWNEQFSG